MRKVGRWLLGAGLPLAALPAVLSTHPYPWLPGALQGLVPAALVLLAYVPLLVAFARDPRPRWVLGFGAVWWGLTVIWLCGLDPLLGPACWAVTVGLVVAWTLLLGWALCRVRRLWGLDAYLWLAPFVWTAYEKLKGTTSLVSPWGSAFNAFWRLPVLLQVIELTGPFALSFVIVMVNAGLARWLLRRDGRQLRLGLGLLAGLAAYGALRLATLDLTAGEPRRVALVQPNIAFEDKRTLDPHILLRDALDLTSTARPGADLTIWPETTAAWIGLDRSQFEPTRELVRAQRTTLLAGTIHTCVGDGSWTPALLNGALVFAPDGELAGFQGKVRIVPFGEYTPGRRYWPLRVLARYSPQFFASRAHRRLDTPAGPLGVAICFEGIFPADCRTLVRAGAQALVVMTNDDQLLQTGARQHYQQAVFRCVETRRWMARCANGGVSAVIDPAGRVVAQTRWKQRTVLDSSLRLRGGRTPFVRLGDWFGWLSVIIAVVATWGPGRQRRARGAHRSGAVGAKDGENDGQGTDSGA